MAASFLWTSVFFFLILELILTMILVIPVPRKIRNWICRETSKLNLKQRLQTPLICIGFALAVALLDSLSFLQLIFEEEKDVHDSSEAEELAHGGGHGGHGGGHGHYTDSPLYHLEKEKEYRTERNIYLAGFALTLLFVIGRITDLMQEHVELEDDLERVRLSSKPPNEPVVDTSAEHGSPAGTVEIEMKEMPKKPTEKKND